jgi:hypothetical protein
MSPSPLWFSEIQDVMVVLGNVSHAIKDGDRWDVYMKHSARKVRLRWQDACSLFDALEAWHSGEVA